MVRQPDHVLHALSKACPLLLTAVSHYALVDRATGKKKKKKKYNIFTTQNTNITVTTDVVDERAFWEKLHLLYNSSYSTWLHLVQFG